MLFSNFVDKYCIACGGNWTAMLISGIKNAFPEVYDKMPSKKYEFAEICEILTKECKIKWD